jgi:hypothetical protein
MRLAFWLPRDKVMLRSLNRRTTMDRAAAQDLAGAEHTCCQIVLEFGKPHCAVASIVDADLVVAQSGNRDLSVDRPD